MYWLDELYVQGVNGRSVQIIFSGMWRLVCYVDTDSSDERASTIFYSEDRGSTFLPNVDTSVPNYTASRPMS
jgi:hypothetical protein